MTQEWVADALGIPRELLSYWETGARTPNAAYLREIARLYRTTPELLRDPTREPDAADPLSLLEDELGDAALTAALASWSSFLDRWAEFLRSDLQQTPPGPGRPPPALAEKAIVHDRRRASALADKVRQHWNLGQFALPELDALLGQQNVLVCRQDLGGLDGADATAGVFYNHAELGFCAVVNARSTRARQTFTLAHGTAHALFHYSEVGILCRIDRDDRLERFGDAFAEHLLVPGRQLRRRVGDLLASASRAALEPIDALALANLFRVSFPLLVMRLASERLIAADTAAAWREIDGRALAERLGLEAPGPPEGPAHMGPLDRYPASVLRAVKLAVAAGAVPLDRAAEVLEVDPADVAQRLLAPAATAGQGMRREHDEFARVLSERR